jgi:hypothetical protein
VSDIPIMPIGQSASVLQVGTQIMPMGEFEQVQPVELGGQAPAQSLSIEQDFGPIMPPLELVAIPIPLEEEPLPPLLAAVPW